MSTYKKHLTTLMQLPNRGTGTKNEKKAAKLIAEEFESMGYVPETHTFQILKHGWLMYFINFALFLFAGILLVSNLLTLSVIFLLLAIGHFYQIPFDWDKLYFNIFKGHSQNVHVELKSSHKADKTLVLLGHYDTGKVIYGSKIFGIIFKTFIGKKIRKRQKVKLNIPQILQSPALLINSTVLAYGIAFVLLLTGVNLAIVYTFAAWGIFWSLMHLLFTSHVLISPFVPGALDNGSGAAMVMALAEYFKSHPLEKTNVIFLTNGSEESRAIGNGAMNFVKKANLDLDNTFFLNYESISDNVLSCVLEENDNMGSKHPYDAQGRAFLLDFLEKTKSDITISKIPISSDCSTLQGLGCRIITMFVSFSNEGMPTHYHMMSDTLDNVNWETLDKCYHTSIDLIQKFDKEV